MGKGIRFLTIALLLASLSSMSCLINREAEADVSIITIVSPSNASTIECLVAQEVRRYVYLRTGKLLPIIQTDKNLPSKTSLIIVGQKDRPAIREITDKNRDLATLTGSLETQQYLIKTVNSGDQQTLLIIGGDSIGTLYAAYRFA